VSKSDKLEAELLAYLFNSTAIPTLGTDVYVALHTADPTESGAQNNNEATYTSYARVQLTRADGTAWIITGSTANPAASIDFPQATGGSETITHFSVGKGASGATDVLYYGTVTPNIAVTTGVTPSLTTATAITED
jgi:hypothetical protein